jgi:hypothetical protein
MVSPQNLADWRGKALLDSDGEKIGKLEYLYVDNETDEPQFGTVKEGVIGKHITFVPLADATVSPDSLQVTVTKGAVKDAPNIDSGEELTADQEADLYRHFGMTYLPPSTPSGRRLARR